MKSRMNLKKLLAYASLGVVGFASVTTVTACNPAAAPMATNMEDIAKSISDHKFTKEEVALSNDTKADNVQTLKDRLTDALAKVFKDKVTDFKKMFSIEKVLNIHDQELTNDDLKSFNDETTIEVTYKLNNKKENKFKVNVVVKADKLEYATEDGFSVEDLTQDIINEIFKNYDSLEKDNEILSTSVVKENDEVLTAKSRKANMDIILNDFTKVKLELNDIFKKINTFDKSSFEKEVDEIYSEINEENFITEKINDSFTKLDNSADISFDQVKKSWEGFKKDFIKKEEILETLNKTKSDETVKFVDELKIIHEKFTKEVTENLFKEEMLKLGIAIDKQDAIIDNSKLILKKYTDNLELINSLKNKKSLITSLQNKSNQELKSFNSKKSEVFEIKKELQILLNLT